MMECIRIEMSNYNIPINLAAKASAGFSRRTARAEAGYAMAALLVGLAVMAIVLSVAMPTWSHMIRRDKEEELVFRGTQYARAINQYQRKFANASPASIDVLLEQRLLRKKFRDPLSPNKDGEFQMLYLSTQATSARGGAMGAASGAGAQAGATLGTKPSGGIVGVASKNTGTSILIYKGKTHYNEWQFVGMEQSTQGGTGGEGGRGGAQRGGRGGAGRDGVGGREGSGPFNRGGFGDSGVGGRGGAGADGPARGTSRGPSQQR
jgi:type II secretory pathway pseudopilin PulG